jgi:hypothetical protein
MYELKQRAIHEGIYPKHFPIPVLAQEFTKMAHQYGRVTENYLATKMFLKTNPRAAFGMWKLGLALMRTGRFPFAMESVKNRAEIAKLLDTVGKISIDALPKNGGESKGGKGSHKTH